MKTAFLLGIAGLAMSAPLAAQETTPPQDSTATTPPAGGDMGTTGTTDTGTADTGVADPAAAGTSQTAPPPSDPNAGVQPGTVPATAGEMIPADPTAPQNPAAPVGSSANPVVVGGNATPPPAPRTDYPLCSRTVQDSCINPGEARRSKRRR